MGPRTSRASEALPENLPDAARAALPRPSVRLSHNPELGDGRGLFAQLDRRRWSAARLGHEGQRPHSLLARRRRASHAQRGRARSAGDRNAGGARRVQLEELQLVRNWRGLDARRRALPHSLVGAGAAQPFARADRHLSALGIFRRGRENLTFSRVFVREFSIPELGSRAGFTERIPARGHAPFGRAVRVLVGRRLRARRC